MEDDYHQALRELDREYPTSPHVERQSLKDWWFTSTPAGVIRGILVLGVMGGLFWAIWK